MQNIYVPDYLKKTVIMIQTAFPERVNKEQYFSLLYLLYDYMCDENLAIVMSYITGEKIATVTNDIWGVNQRTIVDCGTAAAAPVPYRKTAGKKTAIFDASVDFTNWNC